MWTSTSFSAGGSAVSPLDRSFLDSAASAQSSLSASTVHEDALLFAGWQLIVS